MTPRDDVVKHVPGCPYGAGCEHECPLKPIRELPRTEAYRRLLKLSDGEIADIEQAHKLCRRNPDREFPPHKL